MDVYSYDWLILHWLCCIVLLQLELWHVVPVLLLPVLPPVECWLDAALPVKVVAVLLMQGDKMSSNSMHHKLNSACIHL